APATGKERAPAPRRADRAAAGKRSGQPDPGREARPVERSHLHGDAARARLAKPRRAARRRGSPDAQGCGGTLDRFSFFGIRRDSRFADFVMQDAGWREEASIDDTTSVE